MSYKCDCCGTPLSHIDEPCPNCLPSMAERPPTFRSQDMDAYLVMQDKLKKAEAERDEWERLCQINIDKLNETQDELAEMKKMLDQAVPKVMGERIIRLQKRVEELKTIKAERDRLNLDRDKLQAEFVALLDERDRLKDALEKRTTTNQKKEEQT